MAPLVIDWTLVDRPKPYFSQFNSRRSVVYGTKGIQLNDSFLQLD